MLFRSERSSWKSACALHRRTQGKPKGAHRRYAVELQRFFCTHCTHTHTQAWQDLTTLYIKVTTRQKLQTRAKIMFPAPPVNSSGDDNPRLRGPCSTYVSYHVFLKKISTSPHTSTQLCSLINIARPTSSCRLIIFIASSQNNCAGGANDLSLHYRNMK